MDIRKIVHSRTGAVVAGATVLVSLGGVSGAVAATQITSHDIKNQTIQKRDVGSDAVGSNEARDGTLAMRDLNDHANNEINQKLSHPTADGTYNDTWKGDGGATMQSSTVKCAPGKVAIGGGFSGQGGADDTGNPQNKDIQITASYPYFSGEYKPVNERGSFVPNEWVVKGFNHGSTDQIVRPWVVCADAGQAH